MAKKGSIRCKVSFFDIIFGKTICFMSFIFSKAKVEIIKDSILDRVALDSPSSDSSCELRLHTDWCEGFIFFLCNSQMWKKY